MEINEIILILNIELFFVVKKYFLLDIEGFFLSSDLLNKTRSNIEGNFYFYLKQKIKETQIRKLA